MSGGWIERDELRQTVQLAIAAGLSIVAGTMLSGQRWYWALIAAFIVGMGAGSRGEAIVKGLQRLVGTLAGVLVGIALATLLSGHLAVEAALALLFVFLAFYAFQAAYGTMIFFITLMLALLYGMLGQFKPELLELRLEETAIGAVIGMLASTFILPVRQREAFADQLTAFLDALDETIAVAAGGEPPSRGEDGPVRGLVQAGQDLRNAVGGLKRGWLRMVDKRYLFAVRAAMRCAYLAREAVYRGHLSAETCAAAHRRIDRIRGGETEAPGVATAVADDDPLAPALLDALDRLAQRAAAIVARR